MYVLMGGSFDPVHEGHLRTAVAVKQWLQAERVYLVPAARSPLKQQTTADEHRLAMLQLATVSYPGLAIDDRELRRPPPSFTIDTLRELRAVCGDTCPLICILGSDSLAELERWKDWQQLTDLAHLVFVSRPGLIPLPTARVAAWLAQRTAPASRNRLNCTPCGQCVLLDLPPQPFSSTAIRQALRQGEHPEGLPDEVWHYIRQHKLYT